MRFPTKQVFQAWLKTKRRRKFTIDSCHCPLSVMSGMAVGCFTYAVTKGPAVTYRKMPKWATAFVRELPVGVEMTGHEAYKRGFGGA